MTLIGVTLPTWRHLSSVYCTVTNVFMSCWLRFSKRFRITTKCQAETKIRAFCQCFCFCFSFVPPSPSQTLLFLDAFILTGCTCQPDSAVFYVGKCSTRDPYSSFNLFILFSANPRIRRCAFPYHKFRLWYQLSVTCNTELAGLSPSFFFFFFSVCIIFVCGIVVFICVCSIAGTGVRKVQMDLSFQVRALSLSLSSPPSFPSICVGLRVWETETFKEWFQTVCAYCCSIQREEGFLVFCTGEHFERTF